MNTDSIQITNKTKGKLPRLPFVEAKEKILGNEYNLSLVFIGASKSRELNQKYRTKDKVANVLSFPLENNSGEIFITPSKAKTEAKKFDMTTHDFILYLFIHGLLHLKGLDHGEEMDREEEKYKKEFIK